MALHMAVLESMCEAVFCCPGDVVGIRCEAASISGKIK